MGLGEIIHMDVSADTYAIGCLVIATKNCKSLTLSGGCFTCDLDKVGGFRR